MITVATRSCHNHGASTNGSLFPSMFTRTTASMAVPLSVRALSGGLLRLWRTLALELFFHLRLMDNGSRRLALASCHHSSQDLATTSSVLTRLPPLPCTKGALQAWHSNASLLMGLFLVLLGYRLDRLSLLLDTERDSQLSPLLLSIYFASKAPACEHRV